MASFHVPIQESSRIPSALQPPVVDPTAPGVGHHDGCREWSTVGVPYDILVSMAGHATAARDLLTGDPDHLAAEVWAP